MARKKARHLNMSLTKTQKKRWISAVAADLRFQLAHLVNGSMLLGASNNADALRLKKRLIQEFRNAIADTALDLKRALPFSVQP